MHRVQLLWLFCLLMLCQIAPATKAAANSVLRNDVPIVAARPLALRRASQSCSNDPTLASKAHTLAISGTLALLGDYQALTILDVSDPARPTCRSQVSVPTGVTGVQVRGDFAYLGIGSGPLGFGLEIFDIHDPDNPASQGIYNPSGVTDLAIAGNVLYLITASSLVVLDISNPTAPVLASTYALNASATLKVVGKHLFVNNQSTYTFEIFDLADPLHPTKLGSFYQGTIGWYGFSVAGNRAYLLRSAGGVDVLDLSNPSNPVLTGTYTNIDMLDGYFHPTTNGIEVVGNRLYIADTRFQIYDLSSPTEALLLASYDAPGAGHDMELIGQLAYIVNPEFGLKTGDYGFEIIDISNQASPFLRGWFLNGSTGRFFYMQPIRR
ncbi:MAG TPA: hypothetical protein VFU22_02080 [Roseiflexaceae bacterium]|nr:hypothetical protein [Roseiflexaceae bacterium]